MEQAKALELTDRNRLFIHLILSGNSTVEAHKLAGYKGDDHAAYELRCKLGPAIAAEASARGVSEEGLMADMASLDSLPVAHGGSVTVEQKLKLMGLKQKFLKDKADGERELTRFVVGKKAEKGVIDVEPVAEKDADPGDSLRKPHERAVGQGEVAQALSTCVETEAVPGRGAVCGPEGSERPVGYEQGRQVAVQPGEVAEADAEVEPRG